MILVKLLITHISIRLHHTNTIGRSNINSQIDTPDAHTLMYIQLLILKSKFHQVLKVF